MKKILKKSIILPSLALLAAVSLTACSDWIEQESLDIKNPSLEDQNPALNAAYLESLRAFKAGQHRVLFVGLENTEAPGDRSQNIAALPDSVDFIVVNNPNNLSVAFAEEMNEVHQKSTKVIYKIDYAVFDAEWVKIQKEDIEGVLTEEDELAYFARRTKEMLALCAKHNFDGLIAAYPGRALVSLPEAELVKYTARQKNFLDLIAAWRSTNSDKAFSFAGTPQFLVEENRALLSTCDYIILPTEMVGNVEEMGLAALMALADNVPSDRFVFATQTVRPNDEEMIIGYFGTMGADGKKERAVAATARWINTPAQYTKAGMFVLNIQNDYFDVARLVYRYTREAIDIMNPSPKK